MRVRIFAHASVVLVITGLAVGCARQAEPRYAALHAELAMLHTEAADARAQNAIRGLMHAYGRLIDARDWDGFAALWTNDAAYAAGPGRDTLKGGPAIASFLRNVISSNPAGVGEPNFHVFFNEEIHVTATRREPPACPRSLRPLRAARLS